MPVYKDKTRKTWYFSTYYIDHEGKRKKKMKRGFEKKSQAVEAEREFLNELERKKAGDLTLREVVEHRLNNVKLAESTRIRYDSLFNTVVEPFFGNMLISEITLEKISEFKMFLIEYYPSQNTARTAFINFRTIINHAVAYFNMDATLLKKINNIPKVPKEIKPIEIDHFNEQVWKFRDIDHSHLSILMYYSGLRVREALGLQWKHVSFENDYVFLEQAQHVTRNEIVPILKTKKSYGRVYVGEPAMKILKERFEEQKKKHQFFNEDYFIFSGYKMKSYFYYQTVFREVFPDNTPRDLRHSFASHLANTGTDMFVLRDLMRHEHISTTFDIYTHVYDDKKKNALKAFEEK